jgi:hypothetical protein
MMAEQAISTNAARKSSYQIRDIFFEVPAEARVYAETESKRIPLTFIVDYPAHPGYRIYFQVRSEITSPQAASIRAYEGATQYYADENLLPFEVKEKSGQGWRCRKRFEDGFRAPLTIESLYLSTQLGTVEIQFVAEPDVFFQYLPEFNAFLDTIKIG